MKAAKMALGLVLLTVGFFSSAFIIGLPIVLLGFMSIASALKS